MSSPVENPSESTLRVSVEEPSSVVRILTIAIDAARVTRAFDRAYADLGRRAHVQGFRPGRVPRGVLEKRHGAAMVEEIERQLVNETLPEAFQQTGLLPVSEPAIDAGPPLAGVDYRYTARIEIKPDVTVPELSGLAARRTSLSIEAADVDRVLEDLRQRKAPLVEEPVDACTATGHILNVDFTGRIDGVAFEGGSGEDVEIEIGSDRFIPGFEMQLVGAKAGERVDVQVRFPDDYGHAEVAGKDAVFDVQVHTIRRRQPAVLDDEFAKDFGDFETLDALRDRIRTDLLARRQRDSRSLLERTLLDGLLERTSFEVPPGLVDRRLQRRLEEAHRELGKSVPHEALHAQMDRWAEQWRPEAERDVRVALVLEAVARVRGFTVDDAEVDARIDGLAAEQGVDASRLRRLYREQHVFEALRVQMVDEKALESLIADAKIEEVPAS